MENGRIQRNAPRPSRPAVESGPSIARGPKAPLSADNLMRLTKGLAAAFPHRVFGTEQGLRSAEWMANQMKGIGLLPAAEGSFLQAFDWQVGDEVWSGQNVCGLLRGTDPKLANEYILVAAHHDSQEGTAQGANDNASGCAAVLALAQALAKDPPKRSVLFITFDGEEGLTFQDKYQAGRRGSKAYADSPMVPLAKTALCLNMDMIGQVHLEAGSRKDVHQWASRDVFAQGVLQRASKAVLRADEKAVDGYPEQHDQAQMFSTDAEPLYRVGVPIVNFLSGRDLDNHAPSDDITRVIPERIEQYTRLAHAVAVEAANHAESLSDMGITPGGLMPTYPLIRAQKSAGTAIVEEESLRLLDLSARLPAFKAATAQLVKAMTSPALEARAGVSFKAITAGGALLSELTLARVRELHAELADAMHGIDKNDVVARKPLEARLDAVRGIEDVLAGAIYLSKIEDRGGYYLQQVPERLGDLLRGARLLGLDAKLEGVVLANDAKAFTAEISADRAVSLAWDSLSGLASAVGAAAYALIDPADAAATERAATAADLRGLREALIDTARQVAGDGGPASTIKPLLLRAMLQSQLGGIKGSEGKWLERFAAKNRFTEFSELVANLGLPPAEQKAILADAKALGAGALGDAEAILRFYSGISKAAFGETIESLSDVRALSDPKALEQKLAAREAAVAAASNADLVARANDAPEVARMSALSELGAAALALGALFEGRAQSPKAGVTLAEVKTRVDAVRDAARAVPGQEAVAAELDFWSAWLPQFAALEPMALAQAKDRRAIATRGLAEVDRLWPEVSARLGDKTGLSQEQLASGPAVVKEIVERLVDAEKRGERDLLAEVAWKRLLPYAEARHALAGLVSKASPKHELALGDAVDALRNQLGDAAVADLQHATNALDHSRALGDVQVGRKDRGGPLGVLAVRMAQQRSEG